MGLGFVASSGVPLSGRRQGRALCPRTARLQAARPRWRATAVDTEPAETCIEWKSAKELSGSALEWPAVMDVEDIMKVLPHRFPFLLIDRVVAFEPGKRAIAIKNVSMNEPHFTGHFPDRPIMPGVLQIEALAQVGGIVMLQQPISDGKGDFFFGGVDNVKWRKPVVPGDTLVLEMTLDTFKPRFGIAKMIGKGFVDGKLVVQGDLTLVKVVEK